MIIVKLILLIVLMILLLRRKIAIGVVLLFTALITGFMFLKDISDMPLLFFNSFFSYLTLKLLIIIYSVFLLSALMKEYDLKKMLEGVINLFPNLKIAMIIPPMTIGLLPMPGGAMLSAPIVDEIGSKMNVNPAMKTYINFWFRHIWEYAWPLYPGLILTASILDIGIKTIVIYQFYLTIIAIITGLIMISRIKGIKSEKVMKKRIAIIKFISGIWPILLIIVLILFSNIKPEFIVLTVTMLYLISLKIEIRKKLKHLYKSITIEAMLLIIGLIIFKDILEYSQALVLFVETVQGEHLFTIMLLIIVPFIVGFLTGINQGYVGIALPVLAPFLITNGTLDMVKLTLFYSSGFAGILISPAHLCLSLTKEYFKADFTKIYKYLIPSTIPILIIPIIIYMIFR